MTVLRPPRTTAQRADEARWTRSATANLNISSTTAPLRLELGGSLGPITVAYESWGTPSPKRDNAILIEHALTGDSHAAGEAGPGHPTPGWWDSLIGPGAGIDTDRWWVVCPNALGGCRGTTGPSSPSPDGKPWGSRFPTVTVRDQVAVEAALADAIGDRAMGGGRRRLHGRHASARMGRDVPPASGTTIVLACGAAATAEQIALCAVQSDAIRLDPAFHGGDYYDLPQSRGPYVG